jgi:hypothetical protein
MALEVLEELDPHSSDIECVHVIDEGRETLPETDMAQTVMA